MRRSSVSAVTMAVLAGALVGVVAGPARAQGTASGNAAQGEKDFAICKACHQIGPGAKNAIGPVLNGVVGRKAASYPGYEYSSALKAANITWTVPELQKWLAGPEKLVPGTKMAFPGFTNPQQVSDVIAYLDQFNENGQKK